MGRPNKDAEDSQESKNKPLLPMIFLCVMFTAAISEINVAESARNVASRAPNCTGLKLPWAHCQLLDAL